MKVSCSHGSPPQISGHIADDGLDGPWKQMEFVRKEEYQDMQMNFY